MGSPLSTSPCKAPGWVWSTPDEIFNNYMAASKISKRLCPDSDSDSDPSISSFPRFVELKSLEHLTKINPFVVHKVISGIVKPVSVKKLNYKHNKSNTECGIIRPTNAICMGSNSLLGSKALSKCEVNPTSGFQDIAFTSNKLLWRPSWFSWNAPNQ